MRTSDCEIKAQISSAQSHAFNLVRSTDQRLHNLKGAGAGARWRQARDERGKLYKLASYASDCKLRKLYTRRRATRAMQGAHNHLVVALCLWCDPLVYLILSATAKAVALRDSPTLVKTPAPSYGATFGRFTPSLHTYLGSSYNLHLDIIITLDKKK